MGFKQLIKKTKRELLADLKTTETTEIADKAVTPDKMADLAAGKIYMGNASNRPVPVTPTGHVDMSQDGTTRIVEGAVSNDKLADGAVDSDKVLIVERDIIVAAESSTGTATNAADAGGLILGFRPSNAESAVKTIALNETTGQLDITLNSAQSPGQDAHVYVKILQTTLTE